jgi:steroid delta-isomerase-like uncharacterized protein
MTSNIQLNKGAVRRLYEDCLNNKNFSLLEELIHPDFQGPEAKKGPQGYVAVVEELMLAFPDIQFTIEDLLGEDNKVAVRWVWTGTHKGVFKGFEASGKAVTNTGIVIFWFRDNKIIELWIKIDRMEVLQQIKAA